MGEATHIRDEELVARAQKEKEAFGLLVERYESPLARYVRRLGVHDSDDAADVLQEVFIKVYRNLNEFDTAYKFSSWIYRIAHNETMSWFRKRRVRPEGHLIENGEEHLALRLSDELSSEESMSRAESTQALINAIGALDEKYREVIILRYFEHKEYDEISDILEIPLGSVGTLIHRAKRKIKEVIDKRHVHI